MLHGRRNMLRSKGRTAAKAVENCLQRMAGMPISGLTWIVERARKVPDDTQKARHP
jgi:hypothetical protein